MKKIKQTLRIWRLWTHALFGKLLEHEIELKILSLYEEGENKNKSLELKAEESDSNSDMALIVKNFRRFTRNEKKKVEEQEKN